MEQSYKRIGRYERPKLNLLHLSAKYLIRLDDACPTMDHEKWGWFENLMDAYNIKPIIAVIPQNNDPMMRVAKEDTQFWDKVRNWQSKGYEIALHGYDHVYVTQEAGLVPLNNFSEFAGVPLGVQKEKIRKGIAIFEKEGIKTRTWVAPGHSFDNNTLRALKEESKINIISDGISLEPFYENDFLWIPQQLWGPVLKKNHTWTICYHPNIINKKQFLQLQTFIEHHKGSFVRLQKVQECNPIKRLTLSDKIFKYSFFERRGIRKMLRKD